MARVLVIDGDASLRASLARSSPPDLVVLALSLPDGDGAELCLAIRADPRARRTPLLVLCAAPEEAARVRAFEAGADDVVDKPFSVRELLLRARALLRRRSGGPAPDVLTVGPVVVDRAARRVTVAGDEVELTRRELDLLVVLCERRGRVQSREVLIADVWGGELGEDGDGGRVVDSAVKRLRRKLGPAADLVATVRGAGYRLAAPDPPAR